MMTNAWYCIGMHTDYSQLGLNRQNKRGHRQLYLDYRGNCPTKDSNYWQKNPENKAQHSHRSLVTIKLTEFNWIFMRKSCAIFSCEIGDIKLVVYKINFLLLIYADQFTPGWTWRPSPLGFIRWYIIHATIDMYMMNHHGTRDGWFVHLWLRR